MRRRGVMRAWHGLGRGLVVATAAALMVWVAAPVPADAANTRHAAKAPATPKYVPPKYASIVIDADSGAVLHAVDADEQTYPASLTKMMTLYMTFEALSQRRIQLEHRLAVSEFAASMAPSKLNLRPGSSIRLEEAILGVVTKSANDAAVVIAEALGGSEENFAAMMTQKARRLGMTRTHFENASGLPNTNQVTTARDMALLGRALIYDFPQYYPYFSTRSFVYAGTVQANHNHLLASYDGADGIKTGFIRASGFNLVASAKRDGRRLIGVVFGGQSQPWRDGQMKRLLDQGFATQPDRTMVANISDPVLSDTVSPQAKLVRLQIDAAAPTATDGTPKAKPVMTTAALTITPPPAPAPRKGAKEAAIVVPATTGNWLVQVGAFKGQAQATAASKAAIKAAHLSQGHVSISPLNSGHSTLYRARVTGLGESAAREACKALERERMACVVVNPAGGVVH